MSIRINEVTGLILAGGRATRMGGVDKGLQLLNGDAMIAHVLRRLQPQVGSVLLNANRNLDAYRQFGVPVCADQVDGFAGPLAGIHAGLTQCRTAFLVTAPCDSPRLPLDLVKHLSSALDNESADVAVAVTGHGTNRQRHPVFMMLKVSLLPHLTAWLAAGGRKVDDWLHTQVCTDVAFNDELAFENVNTLQQLDEIARRG